MQRYAPNGRKLSLINTNDCYTTKPKGVEFCGTSPDCRKKLCVKRRYGPLRECPPGSISVPSDAGQPSAGRPPEEQSKTTSESSSSPKARRCGARNVPAEGRTGEPTLTVHWTLPEKIDGVDSRLALSPK